MGVTSWVMEGFDPGLFGIQATLAAGRRPEDVERILYEELDRLGREGPSEAELKKAKNIRLSGYWETLERISGKASALGDHQVLRGDWKSLFSRPARYEAVKARRPGARQEGVRREEPDRGHSDPGGGPRRGHAGNREVAMTRAALRVLVAFCALAAQRGVRRVRTVREVALPPVREVKLPNGALLLLAEKHDVPLIAVQGYVRGGSAADPPGKEGLAAMTAEMLRKGAGGRTAREIAALVDGAGAELSTGAGAEAAVIAGEFMSRDRDLMVDLVRSILREPDFPDSEFVKLKEQTLQGLRARRKTSAGC